MSRPYDQLFKGLAEDDPRGLLHLFGSLPLDAEAEIEVIDRELGLPVLSVDHVYRIRAGGKEWLVHYEAQTRYQPDVPERLAWYAVALGLKFKLPIESALILLVDRYAPRRIPAVRRMRLGSLEIAMRYRVLKLWEMDPSTVLAAGRPQLLPWVTLMRHSAAQLKRAARQIASAGDRTLGAQFVILGGLRYDRDSLVALLERTGTMITTEMIEESSIYQWILKKGLEQGLERGMERGMERGRLEEARRSLRRFLSVRFPGLETLSELDVLTDLSRIEALFDQVITAADPNSARTAIVRAAQS